MQELTDIINWRRIDANITTSGQPSETQLVDIKALGVTHIINLGPHHNDGALDDEAASVSALGMVYVYIPVEFEAPTDDDFDQFCKAMDELNEKTVHVHCIYNARVSAFFYRYAKSKPGQDEAKAFDRMEGIWRPGKDWAKFIGDKAALTQPNRYKGDDY